MVSNFENEASVTGFHDMYTDFDSWLMAYRRKNRRRPRSHANTYGIPLRHASAIEENCIRFPALQAAIFNSRWRQSPTRNIQDENLDINYIIFRLYKESLQNNSQDDFKSKL